MLYMAIFTSKDDADMTPGIFGYQWISKFQLLLAGNSHTTYRKKKEKKKRVNIYQKNAASKDICLQNNNKDEKDNHSQESIWRVFDKMKFLPTSPVPVSQQIVLLSLAHVSKNPLSLGHHDIAMTPGL